MHFVEVLRRHLSCDLERKDLLNKKCDHQARDPQTHLPYPDPGPGENLRKLLPEILIQMPIMPLVYKKKSACVCICVVYMYVHNI